MVNLSTQKANMPPTGTGRRVGPYSSTRQLTQLSKFGHRIQIYIQGHNGSTKLNSRRRVLYHGQKPPRQSPTLGHTKRKKVCDEFRRQAS